MHPQIKAVLNWILRASKWIESRNYYEAMQFFWEATDQFRSYSWQRICNNFGWKGNPLNLRAWR